MRLLPVGVLIAIWLLALFGPGPVGDLVRLVGDRYVAAASAGSGLTRLPPVPPDATVRPLGVPAPPPAGRGGYEVLHRDSDGRPARFDPCRPAHWVMREQGAPPGALALVQAQIATISQATGLRFVYDGATTEPPSEHRPAYDRLRYGDRWSPVLVAWSDEREHPPLVGSVAGLGGPVHVDDGGLHLVSGVVYLDREALLATDGRLEPGAAEVVLHELGHLVGLAHVADPGQLMHPVSGVGRLGDGDRRGLHELGSGPCSTRTTAAG